MNILDKEFHADCFHTNNTIGVYFGLSFWMFTKSQKLCLLSKLGSEEQDLHMNLYKYTKTVQTFLVHPPSIISIVLTRFKRLSSCHLSFIRTEYRKQNLTRTSRSVFSIPKFFPDTAFIISMKKGTLVFISVQTRSKSNSFKVSKLFLLLYKTEPSERLHNV